MYQNMSIKYLFINLKYPSYVKLQVILFTFWVIASPISYVLLKESSISLLHNAWWVCLCIALAEAFESFLAIKKAKKGYATT
ncbi:hypothetical protein [Pseudocolwellia agarivorans]|jgi:hypothetical protein|uniref:hypothetical protein n=1 Tax=Pseudocolwellia agarivorans TaxID=1911682 RepID=UPI003F885E3B